MEEKTVRDILRSLAGRYATGGVLDLEIHVSHIAALLTVQTRCEEWISPALCRSFDRAQSELAALLIGVEPPKDNATVVSALAIATSDSVTGAPSDAEAKIVSISEEVAAARLKELQRLRIRGLISAEDFNAAKLDEDQHHRNRASVARSWFVGLVAGTPMAGFQARVAKETAQPLIGNIREIATRGARRDELRPFTLSVIEHRSTDLTEPYSDGPAQPA